MDFFQKVRKMKNLKGTFLIVATCLKKKEKQHSKTYDHTKKENEFFKEIRKSCFGLFYFHQKSHTFLRCKMKILIWTFFSF